MIYGDFIYKEQEKKFYINEEKSFETFFQELKIEKDFIYVLINNSPVKISKNSKYIKFTGNGYNESIFIANANQALFIIYLFKFNSYKIKRNDGTFANGIYDDLDFDEIIYKESPLEEQDFRKANTIISKDEKILVGNLSLSYLDYQKYFFSKSSGEFEMSKERENFYDKLNALSKNRFVPICGPKSIGKTTSLLYYLKTNWLTQYFYINLTYWKNLLSEKRYKELNLCICKELFNCMTFSNVEKFYGIFSKKSYISVMDIVIDIFQYLNENFSYRQFCIVIDQYKNKLDINYDKIKEIKTITEVNTNFIVFVCSSINEYNLRYSLEKKIEKKDKFYLNYLFVNKLINLGNEELKNLKDENEISLLKDCGNIIFYYNKIKYNSTFEEKKISQIKEEIMNHIIENINKYFDENDNKKKQDIIRSIHDNIERKKKFIEFKNLLKFFPLKYFNLSINNQNSFIIDDINDDSEIIVYPSYPIVIDCINQIFKSSKYIINDYINNTIITQKTNDSTEFEKNFNEFLWFYRKKYYYYGCKIIDKIIISSLMEMNENDGNIIKNAINNLNDIFDSISIIQYNQNEKHYSTAIIKYKLFKNNIKYFDLYLFQHILQKKEANKRLTETTLNLDKTCLKYLFFIKAEIILEDIFFSYVFSLTSPDNITIKYCEELKINYILFNNEKFEIFESKIDPKIETKYRFFITPNEINQIYILENLNIDYSLGKEKLKKQYKNLNNFLKKKRSLQKNVPTKLLEKKVKFQKYVKMDFRNYDIKEQVIQEYLMDEENKNNEDLVGISFLIDEESKKNLKEINFTSKELSKLFKLMNYYGNNLEILKVIKINNFPLSNSIQNYDCAIIEKEGDNKNFIDMKNKKNISLNRNSITNTIATISDIYLIKFINKKMISKKYI